MWEKNALLIEKLYGALVNWEERFYICPECEEPVYECDWEEEDFRRFICPICEPIDELEEE